MSGNGRPPVSAQDADEQARQAYNVALGDAATVVGVVLDELREYEARYTAIAAIESLKAVVTSEQP